MSQLYKKRNMSNPELYQQLDSSQWMWTPPGAARKKFDPHEFAGYGSYNVRTTPCHDEMGQIDETLQLQERSKVLLHELEATAISGNDILSSTFYVSGLVTSSAGKLAPLCLALVGVVLYLFQGIYHETVMALPCNGGTYNILLNCTSKQFASAAAVFAIIAYITTGVVSALEAVAYLETILPADTIDTQWATIGLLFFFCLLTNLGIQESATFAKYIFVMHVSTLSVLTLFGLLYMCFHAGFTLENWSAPYPAVDVAGEILPGTVWTALFYGFSSAMLGVSGFETSSQFVEEQAPGVFPKTLRNMWAGVMFFNPILSLISFSALEMEEIYQHKNTVLARTARVVGHWIQTQLLFLPENFCVGPAFATLVSIDAFVVLAAALLTGYVGINGLIRRMSMDRCMPQLFLRQNPWTGTDSFILVGFFFLCVSQVVLLDCNVEALGGVYCYAFLSVMTIFAVGNIILKIKRPSLPREISVSWLHSVVGLVSVVLALLGNILGKPQLLTYFFVYLMTVGMLVLLMFQRVRIMKLLYKLLKPPSSPVEDKELPTKQQVGGPKHTISPDVEGGDDDYMVGEEAALISPPKGGAPKEEDEIQMVGYETHHRKNRQPTIAAGRRESSYLAALSSALNQVQDVPFVFFCKHDDLHLLNKAVLYIKSNEQTNKIIIVHCINDGGTNTDMLAEHVKLVDLLYPKVKVSLLIINSSFCAATVEWLSQAISVPINAMFISCPDRNFAMKVAQLRGMRIIASND